MKAFLCHASEDSTFVLEVAKYLKRCLNSDGVFCYEEYQRSGSFVTRINEELDACEIMVIFVGVGGLTRWQTDEVNAAIKKHGDGDQRHFFIYFLGHDNCPSELNLLNTWPCRSIAKCDSEDALGIAMEIVERLHIPFLWDGLPLNPHLFSYERHIIDHFDMVSRLSDRPFKRKPPKKGDKEALQEIEQLEAIRRKWLDGCPKAWPAVVRWEDETTRRKKNRLGDIGTFRDPRARIVAAALSSYHDPSGESCMIKRGLCLPEAGPREYLYFPRPGDPMRVAVAVSGGIAPGINAVIDGIVQRHYRYAEAHGYIRNLTVYGLKNGFRAFDDIMASAEPLSSVKTSAHANEGGSLLGTSRADELIDLRRRQGGLEAIVRELVNTLHVNTLYVIGGDGSMKAAHAIWTMAQECAARKNWPRLSVVAIPKTMDNDILWVWQAFGFLSAVEKAREIIEHLATEVQANPRLCVAQLFGSDSGFVVSHAVLASRTGHCDLALIPEVDFSMEEIAAYLMKRMCERRRDINEIIPRGLVVMAETAIPLDAMDFVDEKRKNYIDIDLSKKEKDAIRDFVAKRDQGKRIQGQTNDSLRIAGSKIVSKGLYEMLRDPKMRARLEKKLPEDLQGETQPNWELLRMFTNEPRHVLRAIPPSCTDIIMGNRLGTLAVDNAMAGYTDFMISQWLTEYVLVPLELVVLGRKRIPSDGIFWKSVVAKTGQPSTLYRGDQGRPSN